MDHLTNQTGPKTNWKLTDDTVRKLEEAFALGASVEEACYFSQISRDTYYRWVKENPELSDRFKLLQQRPIFLARKTLVEGITKSPELALKYLERKKKDEFSVKYITTQPESDTKSIKEIADLLQKTYAEDAAEKDSMPRTS